MVARQTTLRVPLRLIALATLFCWLGAFVVCALECSVGDSSCQTGQAKTMICGSANTPMPTSDHPSKHNGSACNTLKTFAPATGQLVLSKPQIVFCTLLFILPPQFSTAAQVENSILRQPPDRQWLCTPEVCLGPAFHSLAPPALA